MWRFLNTGFSSGRVNMSYDEKLALELPSTQYDGAVRVYGWSPPCISLGYHQSLNSVNLEKCRSEGIDVVWRPTGGRSILHWEELTYSVVLRANGQTLTDVYRLIGLALQRGLRRLNNEISLARPDHRSSPTPRPSSPIPCYASIARFEIQYRGKKLVGSAQRRYRVAERRLAANASPVDEVVLQHGSILIGPAHKRLVEFLDFGNEEQPQRLRKEFEEKSIELSPILNRRVGFEEVAECIKRGFEEEWGIRFDHGVEERNYSLTIH